ncbi:Phenylacetaldehyde reductase [Linum grandiflorum]
MPRSLPYCLPLFLSFYQPTDLIEPAVNGTLSVLKSCAKVGSIKRVVLTASMGSVLWNGKPRSPGVVVDETWFSDPQYCEKKQFWYMLSKTLAEEASWKFSKENGIDLVAINPGFVIGPYLQQSINLTVEEVLKLVNGTREFPGDIYRFVDVRDVANSHILAFEVPSASGRYCIVGRTAHYSEALEILHQHYPNLPVFAKWENDKTSHPTYEISQKKAKSLGVEFTPLEVTLRDTIECFKEKGLLSF